jgi:hypothetical protein
MRDIVEYASIGAAFFSDQEPVREILAIAMGHVVNHYHIRTS